MPNNWHSQTGQVIPKPPPYHHDMRLKRGKGLCGRPLNDLKKAGAESVIIIIVININNNNNTAPSPTAVVHKPILFLFHRAMPRPMSLALVGRDGVAHVAPPWCAMVCVEHLAPHTARPHIQWAWECIGSTLLFFCRLSSGVCCASLRCVPFCAVLCVPPSLSGRSVRVSA